MPHLPPAQEVALQFHQLCEHLMLPAVPANTVLGIEEGAGLPDAAFWWKERATCCKVCARRFGSQRQLVVVEPSSTAGVAVLKLKNLPVNSFSLEFLTELIINLEKLENDKTFRGIIITSDCPKAFSAGVDLREICGKNPAHYTEYWKVLQDLWLRLYLSNLVLISAINGPCAAGGCLIPLTSDYRILADNPKCLIGLNETRLGISAPFWFKDPLVNIIGHRASEHALQLGLLFPPAEALQVGIVDKVVPKDQVQSTALSVMTQWLAIPDHARQLTKNMIRKPTADLLVKHRDTDIQNFVSFISRDSIQKSLQMYLAKLKQNKD
ncbi:enoyl-CoA delta isomerase 1, mitochondrial isoform X2 [Pteropus medius]|uniref:enoyl-CoA delta isomerase 1, mitochondrial isoform X2 n=1 Tax=Pteropus vampyrus TaxID=132908 RepID=UPI00196B58BA|nr:enoyl-CoA delta isomerase 1, mitochondrial isoform X2 [Pteropus giganteus]